MKKLHKIFFVMTCIGLLSACSTTPVAESTKVVKSKNVTLKWDAPMSFTDGKPLTENMDIKYIVYIDKDTDNTHEDKEPLTKEPISETRYTIDSIEHKGTYFVGIQAIAYRDEDGKLLDEPKKSRIAWSSNKADTNNDPFSIQSD